MINKWNETQLKDTNRNEQIIKIKKQKEKKKKLNQIK